MPALCEKTVDDIEDIVSQHDLGSYDRDISRSEVLPRARKSKLTKRHLSIEENVEADSYIPGKHDR